MDQSLWSKSHYITVKNVKLCRRKHEYITNDVYMSNRHIEKWKWWYTKYIEHCTNKNEQYKNLNNLQQSKMSSCCWSWFQMIPSYYFNAWKPGTQRIPSISKQQRTWVWQRSLKSCTTLQVLSRLLRLFTQRMAVPFFFAKIFCSIRCVIRGVIKRMSSKVEQFKCHVLSSPFFWGVSWNFT